MKLLVTKKWLRRKKTLIKRKKNQPLIRDENLLMELILLQMMLHNLDQPFFCQNYQTIDPGEVNITQSLGKRLSIVERDMDTPKRLMALGDDYDMVIDDPTKISMIEAEVDPQKKIIVVDIPDTDATTDDHPILDTGDQS
ncbi:unnamed protein product [Lactuca saligna]|uniref:Uncharacterized protein n=1 Tax=Lactuca saligna TaxID=75948 RepID=A0AA35YY81_LACSI|nr:unnamed protein product [Lactuca saligna]